jgi:SAM-dependent methyltransferase
LACEIELQEGEHVVKGWLSSPAGRYRIERGVPDFRPPSTNPIQAASERSFGREWQKFSREGWGARLSRERAHFLSYTGLIPSLLFRKRVLDAGCGNGRYSFVASEMGPEVVIGADISDAAYVAFANTRDVASILIIRADLAHLPLSLNLDVVYSIGVLHHTPSAETSFRGIARHCAPGGFLSAYLYGRGNPVLVSFNRILRNRVFSRLPQSLVGWLLWVPALVFEVLRRVPLLGAMLISLVNRVVYFGNYHNMYDAYTAGHTSFHAPEEVERWYHENGFSCAISVRQSRTALYCVGQRVTDPSAIERPLEPIGPVKEMLYALFT